MKNRTRNMAVALGEGHRAGIELARELRPRLEAAATEADEEAVLDEAEALVAARAERYAGPDTARLRAFRSEALRAIATALLADEPEPRAPQARGVVLPFRPKAAA